MAGYLKGIAAIIENETLLEEEIEFFLLSLTESLSASQLDSKKWLVDELVRLNLGLGNVFLCAGWYANLLLYKDFSFSTVRSIDVDSRCKFAVDILFRSLTKDKWKLLSIVTDIHNINYNKFTFEVLKANGTRAVLSESPDTIINTSCEHIRDFEKWYSSIPYGKLVVLQSNNGFGIEGHINCCHSLANFEEETPMTEVLFSGERQMPKFVRYLRIGYK